MHFEKGSCNIKQLTLEELTSIATCLADWSGGWICNTRILPIWQIPLFPALRRGENGIRSVSRQRYYLSGVWRKKGPGVDNKKLSDKARSPRRAKSAGKSEIDPRLVGTHIGTWTSGYSGSWHLFRSFSPTFLKSLQVPKHNSRVWKQPRLFFCFS